MTYPRIRITVLTAAALLTAGWFGAGGVAAASTAMVSCDGLAPTITVPAAGMVTFGTVNPDVIEGTAGNDTIHGLEGNDRICGRGGNDNITGGLGDDRGFGGDGDDDWRGGAGSDFFDGGPHNEGDRGDGGAGVDLCVNTEFVISC